MQWPALISNARAKNLRKYIGTKWSPVEVAGSTEKNEPVGLSTETAVERTIASVVGSWLRLPGQKGLGLIAPVGRSAACERSGTRGTAMPASGYKTLHPPRPSGRSPHRPLIFFGLSFCRLGPFGRKSKIEKLRQERETGVDGNRPLFRNPSSPAWWWIISERWRGSPDWGQW